MMTNAIIAGGAFLLAFIGTALMRRYAIARRLLDVPNSRSSHTVSTPRGGGLAIVVAFLTAVVALWSMGQIDSGLVCALSIGGAAIACIGFLDDRRPLPARVRLGVHFAAALFSIYCLGGLPDLQIGQETVSFGWMSYVLGALGVVWVLNLFNFMDGIDGIAASEGVFIGLGGAGLALLAGSQSGAVVGAGLALAAACAGFLIWNWPPARIFMGDVGSGFIGFVVAVLTMAAGREHAVAMLVWLILGGAFFVDATITLVRRVARGERASEAHRSHAYQWLSRRWGNHKRVTLSFIALNLLWLSPCAVIATLRPNLAAILVVVALIPVAVAAILAGAGRAERDRARENPLSAN